MQPHDLAVTGFHLNLVKIMQSIAFTVLSVCVAGMYSMFVVAYLVFDNAPNLTFLFTTVFDEMAEEIAREFLQDILDDWRVIQYINIAFLC